jgi:3-phenylpropionate/cinnamic acid dioxygenase small subunit
MMFEADAMTAADKQGVMDLIARYAICIDSGDLDGYVANFVPDGAVEWAGGGAVGHEAIRRWVGGLMASGRIGGEPAQTRHFVGLPYITADSQRCTARTYVIIFSLPHGEQTIAIPSVGSYTDTCVKTEAGWRFEKRVILSDLGAFTRQDDGR